MTAGCMRHQRRLIRIPNSTDCYYCINNMTCPIHVSYCLVALVTSPDHLSLIMLPVYFITLSDICYTFCCGTLLMYIYILHCIYSALCIPCKHHYGICTTRQYGSIVCCTSACSFLSRHHQITLLYKTGYDYRHDPMITCQVVMILKYDMFIFLPLIICLLYGITVIESCIIYYYRVCITIVYITASFILPLTRSLSDDPGFACPGWRFEVSYCQTCHWFHIGDLSPIRFIGILILLSFFLICPCFFIYHAH